MPASSLLPHEHGAYGQLIFPLMTALAVAGPSLAGAWLTLTVLCGFLAHEPAAVLLGTRGPRARRELGAAAVRWLATCALVGAVAAGAAWWLLPGEVRWSLLVPAVPALVLLGAMLRGREKSWVGEAAAALAFSSAAAPVVLAAGLPAQTALGITVPFALLFVTTTLAVRAVILRVRGGGDPRAASATRSATLLITAASAALLVVAQQTGRVPWSWLATSGPGLLTAAVLALRPPPPAQLRVVGWSLVAVTVVTTLLIAVLTG